jgi:ABC-type multidrug transport system fused ATPase/permease subunit
MIEIKNVTKAYSLGGEVFKALDDVSLTIPTGQMIAITGHSGSGKSTLIRQLLRRYPVMDDNSFLVDGISINEYRKTDIRKLVAYVPQEHLLFARSVEANILIGKSDSSNIDLNYAIKMADFEKDLAFLEDGLDTIVGEYGVTLSGGQKQRLSIARALMKDADILILDDSLSAVDGKTEANIIRNLKEIRAEKTNIIIAHRLTAVEACDEIIVMDQGKIVERGTHNELMKNNGWYAEQYRIQEMGDE